MLIGTGTKEDHISTMNSKELQALGNSSMEDIKCNDNNASEDEEKAAIFPVPILPVPDSDCISLKEGNDTDNRVDLLKNCAKTR